MKSLLIIETHPVQYHAPVYRALQQRFGIPVTAVYGSDSSVVGHLDKEFGTAFAWDTDLLGGYSPIFLSRTDKNKGIRDILRKIDPGAVLIVGYGNTFYQTAIYETLKTNYPILFRAETTDHAVRRGLIKRRFRDYMLRHFYMKCSCLLYIGQYSYQHFIRLGVPKEKLFFSPYCANTTMFRLDESARTHLRSSVRRKLGIGEEEIVLLFSGKLVPRKNPHLLLQAVKKLPAEFYKKVKIVFLGDGRLRKALEKFSQDILSGKVYFMGFRNQKYISDYYHASDLFILPSVHSETWGVVVNEALHHGLFCVVSDAVGCYPDLIEAGITGEVFKNGSAEDLANALIKAFLQVGKAEVRENCRRKVSGYTIDTVAGGIVKAYGCVTR